MLDHAEAEVVPQLLGSVGVGERRQLGELLLQGGEVVPVHELYGDEVLEELLVHREVCEVLEAMRAVEEVRLLSAVRRKHSIDAQQLEYLWPAVCILLHTLCVVHGLVGSGDVEILSAVVVVADHERVEPQLLLGMLRLVDHLRVDLAAQNARADEVIAVQAQASLLQDVVELVCATSENMSFERKTEKV